jgi:hypothetical protein
MPPSRKRTNGVEYITFWYIARIPPGAVREENTGMANEVNYESHLLSYEEAMTKLPFEHRDVAHTAWSIWKYSLELEQKLETEKKENPQKPLLLE